MTARRTAVLLALLLVAAAPSARAEDPVGHVTSLVGDVSATGPGGAGRALACGDPVFAGDTVTTGDGASAGILMDDVLARVDAESALTVGRTAAGTPDTRLDRGRVRVIDARDAGEPARLAARNAEMRVAGSDAEAYVLSEKVGPYAMFCEWDAPLAVSRGPESKQADPLHCVIAKDAEPLYVANAHDERIPATGGPTCPDLASLTDPADHFSPVATRDVAAGPPVERWSNLAGGPGVPDRDPCGDPGSGCAITRGAPGVIIIDEPPPGGDPQPGGGTFPGAGG
jgi:hypothetical protein